MYIAEFGKLCQIYFNTAYHFYDKIKAVMKIVYTIRGVNHNIIE